MEKHISTSRKSRLTEYLSRPEHEARFASFLAFYTTYCFPSVEVSSDPENPTHEFPHLLACGMTNDFQTIVLRSSDGPEVKHQLLKHDFQERAITEYLVTEAPSFYHDERRFKFGTSPLVMNVVAAEKESMRTVQIELTSQSCHWTEHGVNHDIEDIYMLPYEVQHLKATTSLPQ